MHGQNRYLGKLMGIFINMDKMIGGDFETGLASLKSTAEEHTVEPVSVGPLPNGAGT